MILDTLPEQLGANRFIDANEELSGPLDCKHYKRFAEMATLAPGARLTLRGYREPYGPAVVVGELQAEAQMTCRRCLKPVTVVLEGAIRWGIVFSESEIQGLDKDLDPILVEEGQLPLRQAIEDELVLLLPIMPTHESCNSDWILDTELVDVSEKKSPFAVLAVLKN
ncbi:MAG: hypothetical protein CMD99_05490 [Gammaproteobacteria bacterium]|nr:hypothetical protein [Gammaproteobacteria bacterium]|tara:strand:+ start:1522 stop:2022 length:501 start_codon:yes stop_codon:yes gene_type:complete